MRHIRAVAGLAIASSVVVLAAAVTAVPAHAADPAPTFDQITWGHSALVASGTQMVKQTLSVHVVDPRQYPSNCWEFWETRSGGTGTLPRNWSTATLASGTDADGVWTTSFYLPSTADGTWSLTLAADCSSDQEPGYDVSGSPTFTVTGHHQPRLTYRYLPSPVPVTNPYVTVKGRVYDADTGAGMRGVQLGRAEDLSCLNDRGDGSTTLQHTATTDANGYYTIATSSVHPMAAQCLGMYGSVRHNPDGFAVFVWFSPVSLRYLPSVSAKAATTTPRAGALDAVNGSVVGGRSGCSIILQRLHGSTAWRTVATSHVRSSLRYTLYAQPPSAGRFVYRVSYPSCVSNQAAAVSPRLVLTAS